MKKMIKKISICTLFMALLSLTIFSSVSMPKASWMGPSSLKPYQQKENDMRAIWVATVGNLNIDPQVGKGQAAITRWKNNYLAILDNAEANNLNTIVFQVRPANDAFYPSKYNPWSTFLSPDGTDPGWDPLEWMIEVTHERGLEYHAWLNPYRASTSTLAKSITSKDSVTGFSKIIDYDEKEYNEYKESYFEALREQNPDIDNPVLATGETLYQNVLYGTEGKFILNPASLKVQKHIENTVTEIIDNYDIDGIHFDDYFYPSTTGYKGTNANYKSYTFSCEPSVDMSDYKQYLATTETTPMSIYDWRRENVNKLIKGLSDIIRTKNSTKEVKCAFGISPAARWAPSVEACSSEPERGAEGGMNDTCHNYYSYSDLYADTYKWAKEEWIDYITPQNYSNLSKSYGEITKWWYEALEGCKTKLYIGTALYQVSSSWGDSGVSEIYFQILYNKTNNYDVDGYFIFSYSSLVSKIGTSAMNPIITNAWKYPVLTPLYESYTYDKKVTEESKVEAMELSGDKIMVSFTKVAGAKGYGLYKFSENEEINFDVSHRVDVKLNNNKPFEVTKEEGTKYVIVTYDQDNSIYEKYTIVDTNNKAPNANVTTNKESYKTQETAILNINIQDVDSTTFTVKVQYSDGTASKQITETAKVNEDLKIEYQLPNRVTENGKFTILISDELNTITIEKNIKVTNDAPTAQFNLPKFYKDKEAELTIEVEDDNETIDYELLFSDDGESYNYQIEKGKVTIKDGKATINIKFTGQMETEKGKFKLKLNDGINKVEIDSSTFSIAKEEKSSCRCLAVTTIQHLIALSTILVATTIILRKKGNK